MKQLMPDALKEKFLEVTTVKYHCPKRHKKKCGCFSKSLLCVARTDFLYCLLQAETYSQFFFAAHLALGKYHAHDIHTWKGGSCDWGAVVILMV